MTLSTSTNIVHLISSFLCDRIWKIQAGNWHYVNFAAPFWSRPRDIRTAQNFVRWGGFYPYDYSTALDDYVATKDDDKTGGFSMGDFSPEFDPEVTRVEKQRWRINEATGAMVAALTRSGRSFGRTAWRTTGW